MIKDLEQFYTSTDIARQLINYVKTLYDFDSFDTIIEPCAGNGSFSNYFYYNKEYRSKLLAIDIDPKEQGYIYKYDFLRYNIEDIREKYNLVITNVPFSNSYSFMRKLNEFADVIAVILPASYKNIYKFKTIPRKYHLIQEINIPENAYFNGRNIYDYRSVFMILERRNYDRCDDMIKPISKYFRFVKKTDEYNFAIKRVGFYSSGINWNINPNPNTNYFIKLNDDVDEERFIEQYKLLDFTKILNNSVGAKSLPKYYLINKTNELNLN